MLGHFTGTMVFTGRSDIPTIDPAAVVATNCSGVHLEAKNQIRMFVSLEYSERFRNELVIAGLRFALLRQFRKRMAAFHPRTTLLP